MAAMEQSFTLGKIYDKFGDSLIDTHSKLGQDTVVIDKSRIVDLCRFLRDDPKLEYGFLIDLTAVDFWKKQPRFEVVYHLFSLNHGYRLRIKVPVGEPDPEVDTVCEVWPVANWFEREVYDMFGIKFAGHPDLRRILMYPEFEGHPLRKDYPIRKRQPLIGPQD
jgi:NADH-quinone oxidoreductase subunit C